MPKKRVVVIGGGTGTYTVLSGLKKYPLHLSAIVSMTDSGGSNRIIRDEFGLLPTSDLRQCMVALAGEKADQVVRELFTYRYSSGTGIAGMTFGNLFMAALTDIYKSQKRAIQKTCQLLGVTGDIIPVTYDNAHLVARYENGVQVLGEHYIDEPKKSLGELKIVELELIPKAKANKEAIDAIKKADLIVLGPGDLYTSILCNIIVDGIASAIVRSNAKKVFIMNLMTKFGQTANFKASDHLATLEQYLKKGTIDYCLVNKIDKFPSLALKLYSEEHAYPVVDDLKSSKPKTIRKNLVSNKIFNKHTTDKLIRSLVRHDSSKLAKEIFSLL